MAVPLVVIFIVPGISGFVMFNQSVPAPVFGMIHGPVWDSALDVVMNCDMVIGDETAVFAIAPAKLRLPGGTKAQYLQTFSEPV